MLRLGPDEILEQDKQDCIILKSTITSPKTITEIPTKVLNESISESDRIRQNLSKRFNDQDNEFDKYKLTNLYSFTVNKDPSSDNEISLKNMLMT